MYAIQEYNSLCVQHGANVSIKAVAESYHIPTTTFWKRYIPELSPPPPKLLLSVVLSVAQCSGMFLYFPFFSDSIVMLVFFSVAESLVWLLVQDIAWGDVEGLVCIQEVCSGSTPFGLCFKCPSSTSPLNTIYCTFIFRTRISPVNSGILQGWVSLDHQNNQVPCLSICTGK